VRLDLEEEDLIFGDLCESGGRGPRTVGRRRREDESKKDMVEEVGLTINDPFLLDRDSILIPFLPPPCPALARPDSDNVERL
jgi:hypothetical protein